MGSRGGGSELWVAVGESKRERWVRVVEVDGQAAMRQMPCPIIPTTGTCSGKVKYATR